MLRSLTLAAFLLFALLWAMTAMAATGIPLAAPQSTDPAAATAVTSTNIITVTTTDDELNIDGDCSLREAIQAADTDVVVDNCPAGSDGNTIHIPAGVYVLTLGQLHITGTVILQGSITNTTVLDGNQSGRVLYIDSGATATLLHLNLQNGNSTCDPCDASDAFGGRVVNHGTAVIAYSTIRNNQAGSANPEAFEIYGGKGGGVFNNGTLLIEFSTIHGNNAGTSGCVVYCSSTGEDGGGIYNVGIMTVTNSTISGNKAGDGAFGYSHTTGLCGYGGEGGGIVNAGKATLNNSTVTNNAPGDAINIEFPCEPEEQYHGKVGGVYNEPSASLYVKNSIITDNQGSDCQGIVTSYGNNVIQTTDDCNVDGPFIRWAGRLHPLKNNGGPTLTHALDKKSPAIDAGDCLDSTGITVMVDQRGEPRPQGEGCDIGAYESPYTSTFVITNTSLPLIWR